MLGLRWRRRYRCYLIAASCRVSLRRKNSRGCTFFNVAFGGRPKDGIATGGDLLGTFDRFPHGNFQKEIASLFRRDRHLRPLSRDLWIKRPRWGNVNVTLKEKGHRFLFIPNLCIRSRSFCKAKSQTLAFSHGGRTLKT